MGIAIVAENPSRSLHKISEIYDRIAFAGVGKYNEYDQLRVSGIRHADTKGYAYSREDVDARSLANLYAQYLGQVFTHEMKPLEVEILVAELGTGSRPHQLYHIAYEGTITDEDRYAVLGGETEAIAERLEERWTEGLGPPRGPPGRGGLAGRSGPRAGWRGSRGGRAGPVATADGPSAGWSSAEAGRPCWAERTGSPGQPSANCRFVAAGPSPRYREGNGQAYLRLGERIRGDLHAARAAAV